MKWKDPENVKGFGDDPRIDPDEEDDYPFWDQPKRFGLAERLFKKIEIPLVLIAAAVTILIVLIFIAVSGKESTIDSARIEAMEKRLSKIQDRLFQIEGVGFDSSVKAELDRVQLRLSQVEAAVSQRIDQISTRLSTLEKKKPVRRTKPRG